MARLLQISDLHVAPLGRLASGRLDTLIEGLGNGRLRAQSLSLLSGAAGRDGMADSAIEKLGARPNGERNLANLSERFVRSDTKPKKGKDNLRVVVSRAGFEPATH